MKTPDQFPSIHDSEGRIDDPEIAHDIAKIEDLAHPSLPETVSERVTQEVKKRLPWEKKRIQEIYKEVQQREDFHQDKLTLKYENQLWFQKLQQVLEDAVDENTLYNIKDGKPLDSLGPLRVETKEQSSGDYQIIISMEDKDTHTDHIIYEIVFHNNRLKIPRKDNKPAWEHDIIVKDHRFDINYWSEIEQGRYEGPEQCEKILNYIIEAIATFRAFIPDDERFKDLRHTDMLKNLEDINQVVEWIKKEEDNLNYHEKKYEKASDRMEFLTYYLARKQGKDIRNMGERFFKYTNEHYEHYDEMDEASLERYEQDSSWTRGDLEWMDEHILDYRIDFGWGETFSREEAVRYTEETVQWYDDNLNKALKKWIEFLKTVQN